MPDTTCWSSSSSPTARSEARRAARRRTSARSNGSTRTSGPRRDNDGCTRSPCAASSSTTGALKHTATRSPASSTMRACHSGFRQRSPARYTCHEPVICMCVCRTEPESNRTSRCLALASTASIRCPTSRATGSPATCVRPPVTSRPRSQWSRLRAARKIVSPSGIPRRSRGIRHTARGPWGWGRSRRRAGGARARSGSARARDE